MNVSEVENAIAELKTACIEAGMTSFNRFYFDEAVIFNVTTKDGYLASARLSNDKLILNISKKKAKKVIE